MQRRKWIRRDLRTCCRDVPQQRGFTSVGITDQARIGHRSQLEQKMSLLALLAFGVLARRAITRTFEMNISLPALPALTKNEFLPFTLKIDNQVFGIGF